MPTRKLAIALGLALTLLSALASSAAAAAAPECDTPETWDRPGIERRHELDCRRAWTVEPASSPAHGTLSGFAYDADAQVASWRYRADDGAPADDAFTIRLEGPNGTATQRVAIHVTPRSQNTPPQCQPAAAAQRTAGTAPATVALDVYCWDYENDGFTIDGGGPGEHLDGPLRVRGGDAGGADAPVWHYRTAIARGEEQTDAVGHRRPRRALGRRAAERPGRPRRRPAADLRARHRRRRPRRRRPPDLRPARRDPPLRRRLLRRRPRPADRAPRHAARARHDDEVRARRSRGPRLGQRALGRRRLPPRRRVRRERPVQRRRRRQRPHHRDEDGDRERRRPALVQRPRLRDRHREDDRGQPRRRPLLAAPTTTATTSRRR